MSLTEDALCRWPRVDGRRVTSNTDSGAKHSTAYGDAGLLCDGEGLPSTKCPGSAEIRSVVVSPVLEHQ